MMMVGIEDTANPGRTPGFGVCIMTGEIVTRMLVNLVDGIRRTLADNNAHGNENAIRGLFRTDTLEHYLVRGAC